MKSLQESIFNEGILSQSSDSLNAEVEQEALAKMSFAIHAYDSLPNTDRFGEKLKKGDLVLFVFGNTFKLGKIKRAGKEDCDIEYVNVEESTLSNIITNTIDIENIAIVKITDKSKFYKYIDSLNVDYSNF